MGKGPEQTLLQGGHTDMKKCSTSLAIREMQIITTMRYHLTSVRMVFINKSTNNVLARMKREGNPSTLLVGILTGAAIMENSTELPQKN